MQKVYVSSTSSDTDQLRQLASESIIRLGMYPILFENLLPGQSLINSLKKQIAQADIFVGIYAYRYGHIPDGYDKSLVHLEYEWATERGMPSLIFVLYPAGETAE